MSTEQFIIAFALGAFSGGFIHGFVERIIQPWLERQREDALFRECMDKAGMFDSSERKGIMDSVRKLREKGISPARLFNACANTVRDRILGASKSELTPDEIKESNDLTLAAWDKLQAEQQRRSFAYGNVNIDNPDVTREMVDSAAATLIAGPSKEWCDENAKAEQGMEIGVGADGIEGGTIGDPGGSLEFVSGERGPDLKGGNIEIKGGNTLQIPNGAKIEFEPDPHLRGSAQFPCEKCGNADTGSSRDYKGFERCNECGYPSP